MFLCPLLQRGRSNFFFAFYQEFHVAGKFVTVHKVFKSLDVHKRLSFIVVGTACINGSVSYFRFKRRRIPQVYRIFRLHIVVSVHQDGGFLRINDFFCIDHRMTGRRVYFCIIGPRFCQKLCILQRTSLHIFCMFLLRTYRGNTQ